MKITKVEAIPVTIPLKVDFSIATVTETFTEGPQALSGYVVVKLYSDEGLVGIGEIGRYFEGETRPGIVHTILTYIQPALLAACDPLNISATMADVNRGLPKGNRFAKAAVDIALHDLKGKTLGVPVHSLLGGSYRSKVFVSQTIGIKDVQSAVAEAEAYVEEGYRSLKIKIGSDPDKEIVLIREIRRAVGDEIDLRVDANQGYSTAVAIRTLRAMEACNLSLIEQPVPRWDLDGMRQVCAALDTPILACESARSPQHVMAIAKQQAADMINIKVGRAGGLQGAQKMAAVAEAAGLPVTVGMMMEMGVGTAAAAHFAASCKTLSHSSDFTGPTLLADDLLTEPLHFENSYLHLPDGPGVGVEIDEEKLEYYRVD